MTDHGDAASVAADIDELRRRPDGRGELAALLDETSPIYAGRSSIDAERLRAYVLASFAEGPPADGVMSFVMEQIETGHDPFAVAAAAKVLRNVDAVPPGAFQTLVEAMRRLRSRDAYVWHSEWVSERPDETGDSMLAELARTLAHLLSIGGWQSADPIRTLLDEEAGFLHSAVAEILRNALRKAGNRPDSASAAGACCCASADEPSVAHPAALQRSQQSAPPLDLVLQDQDGATVTFGGFFKGHVSAVVFFYTRCENPEKCSLTISKLAHLQRLVSHDMRLREVRLAAVTYDPAFDSPARIHAYGRDRGVQFDLRTKMLRTMGSMAPLSEYFELGVSYGQSTVNMHRIELAMLDRAAKVSGKYARRMWQPAEVAALLGRALDG